MRQLAAQMSGFISFNTFSAENGERVSIVRFESEQALDAWRHHPEHVEAQRKGREEFYKYDWVQVCQVREYEWRLPSGAG